MAKKVTNVPKSAPIKEFIKCFEKTCTRHSAINVFSDFLAVSAIAISNAVNYVEEREKEYLRIIKSYDKNEAENFPQMLACVVREMQPAEGVTPQYYDVLGELFCGLQLHDEWKGQFFTPQSVSDMIGLMQASGIEDAIKKRGYVGALEPCVGGGSMIIGFVNGMFKQGYNPCKQLMVCAYDLDIRCVYMAYIQLSLIGVPAMIQQRDSLSDKTYGGYWYTPIFLIDKWAEKLHSEKVIDAAKTAFAVIDEENKKPAQIQPLQLSLF